MPLKVLQQQLLPVLQLNALNQETKKYAIR